MNVGLSVSRVGSAAQIKAMKQVSGSIKLDLAQFREMKPSHSLLQILINQQKIFLKEVETYEILKQPQYKPLKVKQQVLIIFAGVKGYLDKISVNDVTKFESFLLEQMQGEGKNNK